MNLGFIDRDFRFGGGDFGVASVQRRLLFVALLLGNNALRRRGLPALVGHLCEIRGSRCERGFGFGLCHLRAGGDQLIVKLRRIDHRKRLAMFHTIADVHQPTLDVTVGAGIDGGFVPGQCIAREGEDFLRRGAVNFGDFNSRRRIGGLLRLKRYFVLAVMPRDQAPDKDQRQRHQDNDRGDGDALARAGAE